MSVYESIKTAWKNFWTQPVVTPTKKEEPVPVSPTSVSTGPSLVSTTATYYGAKTTKKKSVKKPPVKKTKKK